MTYEHTEEILPGIVLGICPLPAGGNLDVAMVLACGARLAVIDSGVAEFMPQALAPALAACGRTLAQVELIINTHAHWDPPSRNAERGMRSDDSDFRVPRSTFRVRQSRLAEGTLASELADLEED